MVNQYSCHLLLVLAFGFPTVLKANGLGDERVRVPVGLDLYVSNNLGAGTIFKAYEQASYVASSLYAYPYFKVGPFLGDRELKVYGEISTAFEWIGHNNPFPGKFNEKFSVGDIKLRAELRRAMSFADPGISISPALKLEIPSSRGSQQLNRILGVGGYLKNTWSKWGFFFIYKPVILGYIHSAPFRSGDCQADMDPEDRLGGGFCRYEGRQTLFLFKNGLSLGYEYDTHTISLGFRTYHSFLRRRDEGEKPSKRQYGKVKEATLGVLEYAYRFSESAPASLIFGLSSYQSPYDIRDGFRWPFVSFVEPAKNETEAYIAVEMSI